MEIIIAMIVDQVIWATRFFGNADPSQATIGKIWWCSGSEQDLLSCPQESRSDCGHDRDAGVYCYGKFS